MLPKSKAILSVKKEPKENANVQPQLNLKTSTPQIGNAVLQLQLQPHSKLKPNAPIVKMKKLKNTLYETGILGGLSKKNALTFAKTSLKRLKAIKYNWPAKKIDKTGITTQEWAELNASLKTQLPMELNYNPSNASSDLIKLGIMSSNSSPRLTIHDMARLQDAILDVILTHSTPHHTAQFEACVLQNEWLQLECTNHNAADWVRNNFELVRNRISLNIELLEEHEFPRHNIEGYFPNSNHLSDHKVLEFVNAQNPISTRFWRVVQRATHGNMAILSIIIDDDSMQALAFNGYSISYRFGRINIKFNGSQINNYAASQQTFWNDEPWTQYAHPSQLYPASISSQLNTINDCQFNMCNPMNFSVPNQPK